jgi:hypothetical protein
MLSLRNIGSNTWGVDATHPGLYLGVAPDIKQNAGGIESA